MNDLFTNVKGKTAIHLATESIVIILNASWCKGELNYDVVIPQEDAKGKKIFCNATYSQKEIEVI